MSCSRASGIDVGKYRVTGYDDFQVKNNTKTCWLFSYFVMFKYKTIVIQYSTYPD